MGYCNWPKPRAPKCPLWVKSRHLSLSQRCPLYPRKQTFSEATLVSAKYQEQTFGWRTGQGSEEGWVELVGSGSQLSKLSEMVPALKQQQGTDNYCAVEDIALTTGHLSRGQKHTINR